MAEEHIDVKIKSWGNGSSSGPWIKLDLEDEEALEKLKSQVGNGFHMILVPIDNGEEGEPEEAQEETKKKGLKLSNEAFFMTQQESFVDYFNRKYDIVLRQEQADTWMKYKVGVASKRELDNPENTYAIDNFLELQKDWRKFVNKGSE